MFDVVLDYAPCLNNVRGRYESRSQATSNEACKEEAEYTQVPFVVLELLFQVCVGREEDDAERDISHEGNQHARVEPFES